MTSIDKAALARIKSALGPKGWIDDPAQMQSYLTSWRNGWTGSSPLIALPATTAEVSHVMTICHENRIAVVPQGGNTGLVGGAIPSPHNNQIVINLSRLNKIRELDPVGSTVTVESGVVLQTLQEEAAKAGFLFPLSMASQGSAEIGGAISTNAGGTAVLRYGNMRDLVLGLEVVLPDGRIVPALQKLPKDNTGYNIARSFIGAEGTLGLITAATLKLFPALKQNLTSVIAIPDAATALDLLQKFRAEASEYLTAFEIISHQALALVVKHIPGTRFPGQDDAPYYLLVEFGASSQHVPLRPLFEKIVEAEFEDGKILDAVIADNAAQAAQFWHLREHVSEALRKEGQGVHFDISLPLEQLADFLIETGPKVQNIAPAITIAPFGHIGDGNLHYNMCFSTPPDDAALAVLKTRIKNLVYDEVKLRHGSISAEHGIGVERKAELLNYKSPVEIELMKALKHAFDPLGLMNPGKIFDI